MNLGYYDQDDQNRYKPSKGKKSGIFFSSLAGAIIGALLIIISVPALSEYGLLPYQVEPANNQGTDQTENDSAQEEEGTNEAVEASRNVSLSVFSEITQAVDKTGEAVVGITNIQSAGSFWSENPGEAGTGSGVIYERQGDKAYVVTNHHVVDGAEEIEVSLSDGTKIPAELLGSDIWTDLAVLEIPAEHVKITAEFGNSDNLKPGEPVIAIGNPLGLTFSGSVTQGIISGVERAIPVDINQDGIADWQAEVLQTDAAINPGNSGGALINIDGKVIGINSMKIAQQAVEGIGLSIPINYARPIIEDLQQFGEVKRPYMGVDLRAVNEIPGHYQQELNLPEDINYGVILRQVQPDSPAERAGLQEMDVIVEMDGDTIKDVIDLRKHLYNKKKIGEELSIKFYRNGTIEETTMTLGGETL